jgi:hypothetical protein
MVPSTVRTATVVGLAAASRLPLNPAAMGITKKARKKILSAVLNISHNPHINYRLRN